MKFREFLDYYVYVQACGGCRVILPDERKRTAFCSACHLKWTVAKTENCGQCFRPAVECTCMPRGLSATGALCLRKLIFYRAERGEQPQNKLIYFLKRNPNRRMARFIAEELKSAILTELEILGKASFREDCLLVSVPRGRSAKNTYGFDQAELICREISRCTGIPFVPVLRRRLGGKEQKKLDRDRRFRNIRHLFRLADEGAVRGKCVLLFDDVVTTGASMAACVNLLKKADASSVICLCIAQD